MAHPMTLPLLGALSLVGAGAGLYLGKAAVGEIDPVYFSTPESGSRWHADLTPNRAPFAAVPLSSPNGTAIASSNCVGCSDYPEEYYPIHDASVDRYESGWAASASAPVQLAAYEEPAEEALVRKADADLVARYAARPQEVVQAAAPEAAAEGGEPLVSNATAEASAEPVATTQ